MQSTEFHAEGRASLTPEHHAYLVERHGTADLEPLPSADPNDPYNWPGWKKNANLLVVAIQGMTVVLNAAGVIPALPLLVKALDVSIHRITYIIGVQILFSGIAPLFWKPLANRFGRRPIWFLATIGGGLFNIGCAHAKSFGSLITYEILTACFLSPALGLGGAVVTETFFVQQRATKLGMWTVAFTMGPSLGPFLTGFVVYHTNSWVWVYWFYTIVSFSTTVAVIFLCPETLYIRGSPSAPPNSIRDQYLSLRRINPQPFRLIEVFQPYLMLLRPTVLVPAVSYSVVFCFSVGVSIIIPTAYGEKFHLNPQQVGLQFLAPLIGAMLGEQVGGFLSDRMMRYNVQPGERKPPEFRLWASYLGFATAIAGVVAWGVALQNAPVGPWTVKPEIGLGIFFFGIQITTTTLVTYAVDCNPKESADVGAAINQVRQIWSFIGPFWFVPMFEKLGFANAGGMMAGLIGAMALLVVVAHVSGAVWRLKTSVEACQARSDGQTDRLKVDAGTHVEKMMHEDV